MVLMLIGIIMIATSRAPITWSVAEYDRAKAACEGIERGHPYELCLEKALYNWRRENPDAPRGSASAWPWGR